MKALYALLMSCFFVITTTAQYTSSSNTNKSGNTGVSLANFQAFHNCRTINISWSAISENNISIHEVQKSTNGSSFTVIAVIPAQNNGTSFKYSFLDAAPINGINYYRLRSVDKVGNVTLSNIITVNAGFRQNRLVVMPNPVLGGVLNLQMSNFESGKYNISLYSNAGQKVFARSMNFSDGSSSEIINLPRSISKGMYFLQVTNGTDAINKQIMLQ